MDENLKDIKGWLPWIVVAALGAFILFSSAKQERPLPIDPDDDVVVTNNVTETTHKAIIALCQNNAKLWQEVHDALESGEVDDAASFNAFLEERIPDVYEKSFEKLVSAYKSKMTKNFKQMPKVSLQIRDGYLKGVPKSAFGWDRRRRPFRTFNSEKCQCADGGECTCFGKCDCENCACENCLVP